MSNKTLNITLFIIGIILIICGIYDYTFKVNVSLFSYCFNEWSYGLFAVLVAIYNYIKERK